MLTPSQKQIIQQAIAQIHQADADQQFALPAGDVCYAVHNLLEDAAEMLGLNFEHIHVGVQGLERSIPVVFQSAATRNVSVN